MKIKKHKSYTMTFCLQSIVIKPENNAEIKRDTNWKNKLSMSEELKNMTDHRKPKE